MIEHDFGAGKPLGIDGYASVATMTQLQSLRELLSPIGATVLRRVDRPVGSDIAAWQEAGVPGFQLLVDGRHYFDYHHSPADTLDKVEPKNLQRMVATLAMLAFYLAGTAEPPARVPLIDP